MLSFLCHVDVDIDKFTISVSGLTIIGFAKWSSLGEMPSIPVAFFTFILLIRFSIKSGVTEEKEKLFPKMIPGLY
jgi:hypothetical protein